MLVGPQLVHEAKHVGYTHFGHRQDRLGRRSLKAKVGGSTPAPDHQFP